MNTLDFFQYLFRGTKGRIALFSLPSRDFHSMPLSLAESGLGLVQQWSQSGADSYFGLCTLKPDYRGSGRGKKDDLFEGVCLWADIDIKHEAHRASNLPGDLEAAVMLVDSVGIEPSMIIDSGHGLHAYWALNEPVRLDSLKEAQRFQNTVGAIQLRLQEEASRLGWVVDTVSDLPRILRVPGTGNYKVSGKPEFASVLISSDIRYDYSKIREMLGLKDVRVGGVIPPTAKESAGLEEIRKRLIGVCETHPKAESIKALLEGQSFAIPGKRDEELQRVASIVAFIAPEVAPDLLVELFRPTLMLWTQEPGSTKSIDEEMLKALDKIRRAHSDANRKKQAAKELGEELKTLIESRGPITPTGGYSQEELEKVSELTRCTPEDLVKRWIIQHKSMYFFLTDRGYTKAKTEKELLVGIGQYLSRAPIEKTLTDEEGNTKDRPITAILKDHCTLAEEVRAYLGLLPNSYLDKEGIFHEALCPQRKNLQPVYNREIDRWLVQLGGAQHERLLDWIATITELDRYTAAIYLMGPPNTGKTLFAHGLSRLWSEEGPVPLKNALDDFNEMLRKCPLLFADEELPMNNGSRTSAQLRELIGNDLRTYNRKYMPQITLHGNIRIILAANNKSLLSFDEDMSEEDYEAIWTRFLVIDTAEAVGYFDGYNPYNEWVRGDGMAQHALWLRDNRQVNKGGRFLVSGSKEAHISLKTQGNNYAILEWLVQFAGAEDSLRSQLEANQAIFLGNGEFLVNSNVIQKNWKMYLHTMNAPKTQRIRVALKQLAFPETKERRVNGSRVWSLRPEYIHEWIKENDIGDAKVFSERLHKRKETPDAR